MEALAQTNLSAAVGGENLGPATAAAALGILDWQAAADRAAGRHASVSMAASALGPGQAVAVHSPASVSRWRRSGWTAQSRRTAALYAPSPSASPAAVLATHSANSSPAVAASGGGTLATFAPTLVTPRRVGHSTVSTMLLGDTHTPAGERQYTSSLSGTPLPGGGGGGSGGNDGEISSGGAMAADSPAASAEQMFLRPTAAGSFSGRHRSTALERPVGVPSSRRRQTHLRDGAGGSGSGGLRWDSLGCNSTPTGAGGGLGAHSSTFSLAGGSVLAVASVGQSPVGRYGAGPSEPVAEQH